VVTTAFSSLLWGEKRGLTPRPPIFKRNTTLIPTQIVKTTLGLFDLVCGS